MLTFERLCKGLDAGSAAVINESKIRMFKEKAIQGQLFGTSDTVGWIRSGDRVDKEYQFLYGVVYGLSMAGKITDAERDAITKELIEMTE